jgi:hypothetical protein
MFSFSTRKTKQKKGRKSVNHTYIEDRNQCCLSGVSFRFVSCRFKASEVLEDAVLLLPHLVPKATVNCERARSDRIAF